MKTISTWRPGRAALVVGAMGVVLGTTGGAHAAGLITGKQIKDGSVTTVDVQNDGINTLDLQNFTLTPADYDGDVTGPQGPQGDRGATGEPGVRVVSYAIASIREVPKKGINVAEAVCENGTHAVAGGHVVRSGSLQLLDSAPAGNPNAQDGPGWVVRVQNTTNTPATYFAFAVCAEVH